VICRNEVIFIDESFVNISQTSDLTSPFNYVKPTMLFYPRYFIMKRELFNKFNPMKPNFEDYMEYNIRVTPFIHAEQQINFTTKYDNILSVRGFEFEKECVLENIRVNYQQGNFPLKVQPVKFIDGSTRKHVLIIEWEVLTPDKDCGSLYMINFIRLLMANNYIVHFIPVNLAYHKKYTYDLQSMGVYVAHTTLSVKDYLAINCNVYDIIFVSRIREIKSFYDDIRLYCPKAKLVFNTVDLNFIRNKRENELTCINEQTIDPVEIDEISYIQRCDLALVVSDYEYTYLKKKNIDVVHFPICYQLSNLTRETDTSGLYFIGSRHTPNIDAINYFLKYIYGSILEIQNVPMYIFGECCMGIEPVLVEKYKGNITVINSIEDDVLAVFLKRVRVNLAPMRYGAGVKGKLLQASNNGVPSISTSIGIEGTEFKHMKDVLVLNIDDEDYAQKFVSYYNDTALLTNIAENARETFRSNYSLESGNTHMIKLNERLEKIQIKKQ
jgi:glycosyltransferase involved in cell wall biosynthesis